MNLPRCSNCTDKICVPGRGKEDAELMLVGEAPGRDEVKVTPPTCWIGKAGQELENYLNRIAGIDVSYCYLTNLCKFHPNNDRDPTKAEIDECSKVLEVEIAKVNPKYIATLGAISSKYFLGNDITLDRVHGIPVCGHGGMGEGRIILPCYHPAAGLHNSTMMTQILYDFEVLGRLVRGKAKIGSIEDKYPIENCSYGRVTTWRQIANYLDGSNIVSIDTESVKRMVDGRWFGGTEPWCMSVSTYEGTAAVVMFEDEELVRLVNGCLSNPNVLTLIHNVMYDKPILDQVGIHPANFRDTMVMAYLTQSLPQGLKDLAYRLCGMEMNSYEEMVKVPTELNAVRYLDKISKVEWPKPEPELVWAKGEPKVKGGWPLHKRVLRILKDYDEDGETDIIDRWNKIEDNIRLPAEKDYGLLPIGDLSEIDIDKAVRYSARDADATLRIYPHLLELVQYLNIERSI